MTHRQLSQSFWTSLERLYRVFLKPLFDSILVVAFGFFSHCPHQPSCGQHFFDSVHQHGTMRGSLLGLRQLLTCWGVSLTKPHHSR